MSAYDDLSPWFYEFLEAKPKLLSRVARDEDLYDDLLAALASGDINRIGTQLVHLKTIVDAFPSAARITLQGGQPPVRPTREQHIYDPITAHDALKKVAQPAPPDNTGTPDGAISSDVDPTKGDPKSNDT